MAKVVTADQDSFNCPICLDLLKDPATIPCGHSFCMSCIQHFWDHDHEKDREKEVYSCPQCRQTFSPRPVLNKSTLIVEMMEKMKKAGLLIAPPSPSFTAPEEVTCDVCSGKKLKAIKSCLVCLASYCETHLRPHYDSPAFKKHKLVNASSLLQENICSHHGKLLEAYCRTDQQCVCMLCMLDKHKGHNVVSAVAERTEKKKHLEETQSKFKQRIQEREQKLLELKRTVESYKRSAQKAVEDSEKIFIELIRSIEKKRSEVTELIQAQKKTVVHQAEGFLERLEREIEELKARSTELEQLLSTEDHIHSLKRFTVFSSLPVPNEMHNIAVNQLYTFHDVVKCVSELKGSLEDLCKQDMVKLSRAAKAANITEPFTREDFLQYSSQLTLDPTTAHKHLCLTDGNKKVLYSSSPQSHADHPARFDKSSQVLCREGLTGRNYWEVELDGKDGLFIAVSYKSVDRKGWGCECIFGGDHRSWRLDCSVRSFSVWHQNSKIQIPAACVPSRIGVYVDYRAGTLSFYSITDTMNFIHRVETTFTEPLYPGFGFGYYGSAIRICD